MEITKGNYRLTIFDPPHSSSCTYEGQEAEGPTEFFDTYKTLETNFGTIRMGRNPKGLYAPDEVVFRACSLIPSFYPTTYYETGTLIGHIEYHVPYNYIPSVINEMDLILKGINLSKSY